MFPFPHQVLFYSLSGFFIFLISFFVFLVRSFPCSRQVFFLFFVRFFPFPHHIFFLFLIRFFTFPHRFFSFPHQIFFLFLIRFFPFPHHVFFLFLIRFFSFSSSGLFPLPRQAFFLFLVRFIFTFLVDRYFSSFHLSSWQVSFIFIPLYIVLKYNLFEEWRSSPPQQGIGKRLYNRVHTLPACKKRCCSTTRSMSTCSFL